MHVVLWTRGPWHPVSISEGFLSCTEKLESQTADGGGVGSAWGRAKGRLGVVEGSRARRISIALITCRHEPPESLEQDF